MAQAHSISSAHGFSLRATLAHLGDSLRLRRARRKLFHQALSELVQLSDRELGDIGIPRSSVRRVAWEHACMNAR